MEGKTISNNTTKGATLTSTTQTRLDSLMTIGNKYNVNAVEYINKQVELGTWHAHCYENLERIMQGLPITDDLYQRVKRWDKDSRLIEDYVLDMLISWLSDDFTEDELREFLDLDENWILYKDGTDAMREFLKPGQAKADPDLSLLNTKTGKKIGLEISDDRSGYVVKNNKLDLRFRKSGTSKFRDLLAKSKEEEYLAVFVVIKDHENEQIGILPIDENTIVIEEKIYNYAWKKYSTLLSVNVDEVFNGLEKVKGLIQ